MSTDAGHRFIVVDDDDTSNLICKLTLEMVLGKINVTTFTNPEEALDYLENEYTQPGSDQATLFLDINMPIMTGWEFLERFDNFDNKVKNRISIYILSSSVDWRDKERSYANKNVVDHLAKPLTNKVILEIVNAKKK